MKPKVLILHAPGTNRDHEAEWAVELAGGDPRIAHINTLLSLRDFQMLILPGGFSYGDDLGAGRLMATAMRYRLGDELSRFSEAGKPILGICNGFQALVKSGLLPGLGAGQWVRGDLAAEVTLTGNESGRFECRWVDLEPQQSSSVFTNGLTEAIYCPVAHGEGRFVATDEATLARIEAADLVALRYVGFDGQYPQNPNGSANNIAGITDPSGTILGLMPHPEDHIIPEQHPRSHRGERAGSGLPLFENGVRYAAQV